MSDCSIAYLESDLFGARPEYYNEGDDSGAKLNIFLVNNGGQRRIVFLDEFEKTNMHVWDSFLLPWDNCNLHEAILKKPPLRYKYYV